MTAAAAEYNRACYLRDRRNHWWHGKDLATATRTLRDAAARRGGLTRDDARAVLPAYRPEAAACALRRALARGLLIECRRHVADGDVIPVYHATEGGTP